MVCGAKRLGRKIEAKRLRKKRPGGKRLGGETSCYPFYMHRMAYRRPPRVESTSSMNFRYREK